MGNVLFSQGTEMDYQNAKKMDSCRLNKILGNRKNVTGYL